MKIVHSNFDDLVSVENIFVCWHEFRKGKAAKPDVMEFEQHLEDNVFLLHEELVSQTYRHGPYHTFHIYDPKFRVKCDVKKFFGTVNHLVLLQVIQKRIRDERFLCLILELVQSFGSHVDNFALGGVFTGLPIGNLTSQIFANIYLNELDQFVKHGLRVKNYFRYADDFVIVHEDQGHLQFLLGETGKFLKEYLRVELHPQKVEIRKFTQGIDFLGYIVLPHHVVLRTKTKKRMFAKLFSKYELLGAGEIDPHSFRQSLQSYLGMIGHSDGYDLKNSVENTFGLC